MTATTLSRRPLPAGLPIEEFDARNWRKDELIACARTLGIPSWGKKPALAARVRRRLVAQQGRRTTPGVTDAVPAATTGSTPAALASPTPVDAPLSLRALARPQFFREVPGLTRSQALAQWYARRKTQGSGDGQ